MNKSSLRMELLEAELIVKNFVKGDESCNYELYITEAINSSEYFHNCFGSQFIRPESQSFGECDSYSDGYGLDYKLVASKTALQARSINSLQTEILGEGEYAVCECKNKTHRPMQVTRLTQALRGQSPEELQKIYKSTDKKQGIENDIKEYMSTIMTAKNLMLVLPYRFSYESPGSQEDDCQSIAKALTEDYKVSLQYRSSECIGYDTYMIFFYDYFFVLCEWNGNEISYIEAIPVEVSETFMHLSQTYCLEWSEKYDVYLQEIRQQELNKSEES